MTKPVSELTGYSSLFGISDIYLHAVTSRSQNRQKNIIFYKILVDKNINT